MTSSMSMMATSRPCDEVQAVGRLAAPEDRASPDHLEAVVEEDPQQLAQPEGARLAVDEGDGVDAEGVLHRRLLVELLEQRLGVKAVLDLDDQPHALRAVGEVLDVGDAQQLLGLHERLDPLDDLLGADAVGQLGDHDALAAAEVLDPRGGPHPEAAAACLVRLLHAVEPDDLAAGRQVGPRDEAHQRVDVRVRVLDEVAQRLDDLDQVVRRDVGGHADGDAGRAVDDQVRDRGRQHARLGLAGVVVGPEVDGVLEDAVGHRHRGRRHPALGVAHRRGGVVGRAEVAVPVDRGQPHRPRLRQPHEGVVDGAVAVGVQPAHHLADDAGALDVAAVGSQAHVGHRVEDPPLDGLQPVAGVGERARVDDRVGVLEEGGPHLVAHVGLDDVLDEVVGEVLPGGVPGATTCHGRILPVAPDGWGRGSPGARVRLS